MNKSFLGLILVLLTLAVAPLEASGVKEGVDNSIQTTELGSIKVRVSPYFGYLKVDISSADWKIDTQTSFMSMNLPPKKEALISELNAIVYVPSQTTVLSYFTLDGPTESTSQKNKELMKAINLVGTNNFQTSLAKLNKKLTLDSGKLPNQKSAESDQKFEINYEISKITGEPSEPPKNEVSFLVPYLHPSEQGIFLNLDLVDSQKQRSQRVQAFLTGKTEFFRNESEYFDNFVTVSDFLIGAEKFGFIGSERASPSQQLLNNYRYFISSIFACLVYKNDILTKEQIFSLGVNQDILNSPRIKLFEKALESLEISQPMYFHASLKLPKIDLQTNHIHLGGVADFMYGNSEGSKKFDLLKMLPLIRNAMAKHFRIGFATNDLGNDFGRPMPTLQENPFVIPKWTTRTNLFVSLYVTMARSQGKPLLGSMISSTLPSFNPFNMADANYLKASEIANKEQYEPTKDQLNNMGTSESDKKDYNNLDWKGIIPDGDPRKDDLISTSATQFLIGVVDRKLVENTSKRELFTAWVRSTNRTKFNPLIYSDQKEPSSPIVSPISNDTDSWTVDWRLKNPNSKATIKNIEIFTSKNLLRDTILKDGVWIFDQPVMVNYILLKSPGKQVPKAKYDFTCNRESVTLTNTKEISIQKSAIQIQSFGKGQSYYLYKVVNPEPLKSITLNEENLIFREYVFSSDPVSYLKQTISFFEKIPKEPDPVENPEKSKYLQFPIFDTLEDKNLLANLLTSHQFVLKASNSPEGKPVRLPIEEIVLWDTDGEQIPTILQANTESAQDILSFFSNFKGEMSFKDFKLNAEFAGELPFKLPLKYAKGGNDGIKSYNYKVLKHSDFISSMLKQNAVVKKENQSSLFSGLFTELDLLKNAQLTEDWTFKDKSVYESNKDSLFMTIVENENAFPYILGANIPKRDGIFIGKDMSPFHINKIAGVDSLGLLTQSITSAYWNFSSNVSHLLVMAPSAPDNSPSLDFNIKSEGQYLLPDSQPGYIKEDITKRNLDYQLFKLTGKDGKDPWRGISSNENFGDYLPLSEFDPYSEGLRLNLRDLELNSIIIEDPSAVRRGDFVVGLDNGEPLVGIITSLNYTDEEAKKFKDYRDLWGKVAVVSSSPSAGQVFWGVWGHPSSTILGGFTLNPERFIVRRFVHHISGEEKSFTVPPVWELLTNGGLYQDIYEAEWYFGTAPTYSPQVPPTIEQSTKDEKNTVKHLLGNIWIQEVPGRTHPVNVKKLAFDIGLENPLGNRENIFNLEYEIYLSCSVNKIQDQTQRIKTWSLKKTDGVFKFTSVMNSEFTFIATENGKKIVGKRKGSNEEYGFFWVEFILTSNDPKWEDWSKINASRLEVLELENRVQEMISPDLQFFLKPQGETQVDFGSAKIPALGKVLTVNNSSPKYITQFAYYKRYIEPDPTTEERLRDENPAKEQEELQHDSDLIQLTKFIYMLDPWEFDPNEISTWDLNVCRPNPFGNMTSDMSKEQPAFDVAFGTPQAAFTPKYIDSRVKSPEVPWVAKVPSGWRTLNNEELNRLGLTIEFLENPLTGLGVRIYLNEKTKEYACVFRGTNEHFWLKGEEERRTSIGVNLGDKVGYPPPGKWNWSNEAKDWNKDRSHEWMNTNIAQAAPIFGFPKQYIAAMAMGLRLSKLGNVTFSGHSLGGGLATIAGLTSGRPVVTYNPAGLSGFSKDWAKDGRDFLRMSEPDYEKLRTEAGSKNRNYVVDGEPLSLVNDGFIKTPPIGKVINVPNQGIYKEFSQGHLFYAVEEYFRQLNVQGLPTSPRFTEQK